MVRTGLIPLGLAFGLAAAPAWATSITVLNPSFENFTTGALDHTGCGTGCSYSVDANIPDWVGSPTAALGGMWGQFQPGPLPNAYFDQPTDGQTAAYSNNGSISQTVGSLAV